jgi:hypothetical protein
MTVSAVTGTRRVAYMYSTKQRSMLHTLNAVRCSSSKHVRRGRASANPANCANLLVSYEFRAWKFCHITFWAPRTSVGRSLLVTWLMPPKQALPTRARVSLAF